ncbi:MAG: hypothetical protein ACOVNR_01395, partial [Chitinophagaceae bacterium]
KQASSSDDASPAKRIRKRKPIARNLAGGSSEQSSLETNPKSTEEKPVEVITAENVADVAVKSTNNEVEEAKTESTSVEGKTKAK